MLDINNSEPRLQLQLQMQPGDFNKVEIDIWSKNEHIRAHVASRLSRDVIYNKVKRRYEFYNGMVDFVSITGERIVIVEMGSVDSVDTVCVRINLKQWVCWGICSAALKYWKQRCYRDYRRTIAQVLQRELELPGEVAVTISELV